MIRNKNIVRSEVEVLIPANLNAGKYILNKMWQYRDNVCMINGETHAPLTYGTILQQAMNVAVSLTHLGVRKGQTVAIQSENRDEYFPAVIGAICAGAVVTTVNVGYTAGELKHVLTISKPKYIFCSPSAYEKHKKTLQTMTFIRKTFVFGAEQQPNTIPYNSIAVPKTSTKSNLLFNAKSNELLRNISYDEIEVPDVQGQTDTAFILYSSGTTGLPKGVMITHLNVVTACNLPSSHDPTLLSLTITPWYHVMGLLGSFAGMARGRTAIYLTRFSPELYLSTVEIYKVVQLTVVPPVLVALCKTEMQYDVSCVKLIYSGAAPLHSDTGRALKTKFPNAIVMQGYGMTELTLVATRDLYDHPHKVKPGAVGYVVPGSTVKVADLKTGEPLGPNQQGEICVKGPMVAKGYVGVDTTTWLDEQGFYRTGDIGYYDEDLCFFIVDRLKELIKYKGYQVPPAEIEAVLLTHPAVRDAGVVAKEDRNSGEVPVAFVVKLPGVQVTEDQLKTFVAEKLSNPKHLRGGVRFIEQIPKSPSGKILRKDLKKMLRSGKSKL